MVRKTQLVALEEQTPCPRTVRRVLGLGNVKLVCRLLAEMDVGSDRRGVLKNTTDMRMITGSRVATESE